MMRQNTKYQRLPGRGVKRQGVSGGYYHLYEAEDHLLWVFSTISEEKYRRFYFKDIHSIQVSKTRSGFYLNLAFGAILLVFGVLVLSYSREIALSTAIKYGLAAAALPVLGIVLNLIAGPTCRVFLQTAVQRCELNNIRRIRTWKKIYARIDRKILKYQGNWTEEKLQILRTPKSELNNQTAVDQSSHNDSMNVEVPKPPPLPWETLGKNVSRRFHWLILLSTSLLAVSSCYNAFYSYPLKHASDALIYSIFFIMLIRALIIQNGTDIPIFVQSVIKLLLATVAFAGLVLILQLELIPIVGKELNWSMDKPPRNTGITATIFNALLAITFLILSIFGLLNLGRKKA